MPVVYNESRMRETLNLSACADSSPEKKREKKMEGGREGEREGGRETGRREKTFWGVVGDIDNTLYIDYTLYIDNTLYIDYKLYIDYTLYIVTTRLNWPRGRFSANTADRRH